MSFPQQFALETPILQELVAVGGAEDVRFLYERLINYFPQLSELEIRQIRSGNSASWRKIVQRAAKELDDKRLLKRERGFWTITARGEQQVISETQDFIISQPAPNELTHGEIQQMLIEIGESLGFYAQPEFEFYDVVWRENQKNTRLSHVFEVQSKGNIDSAFAKLKRAYVAQRSKIYLVVSTEKDLNRARKSLEREFQELEAAVRVITFPQIKLVADNLRNIGEIVNDFLLK